MGWSDFNASARVLRVAILSAWAASVVIVSLTSAQAQAYPSKPVRIICTFAAGGTTAVHYRGASQALIDMHGGHIDINTAPEN